MLRVGSGNRSIIQSDPALLDVYQAVFIRLGYIMKLQIAGVSMLFNNMTFLVIFVVGIILMIVGFGFRDRNLGMVLLGVSFLAVLAASIKKAIELFS